MRDIKFRAWHNYLKDYDEVIGFEFTQGYVFLKMYGKEMIKNVVLEQYTGLKDKNGVEIYEGDIVRDNSGQTHTVEYTTELITNCGCCYTVIAYGYDFSRFEYVEDTEVIGNIHKGERK